MAQVNGRDELPIPMAKLNVAYLQRIARCRRSGAMRKFPGVAFSALSMMGSFWVVKSF
jgi:hypothetical protein